MFPLLFVYLFKFLLNIFVCTAVSAVQLFQSFVRIYKKTRTPRFFYKHAVYCCCCCCCSETCFKRNLQDVTRKSVFLKCCKTFCYKVYQFRRRTPDIWICKLYDCKKCIFLSLNPWKKFTLALMDSCFFFSNVYNTSTLYIPKQFLYLMGISSTTIYSRCNTVFQDQLGGGTLRLLVIDHLRFYFDTRVLYVFALGWSAAEPCARTRHIRRNSLALQPIKKKFVKMFMEGYANVANMIGWAEDFFFYHIKYKSDRRQQTEFHIIFIYFIYFTYAKLSHNGTMLHVCKLGYL